MGFIPCTILKYGIYYEAWEDNPAKTIYVVGVRK